VISIEGKIDPKVGQLWEKFYPDYNPHRFQTLVESLVDPSARILEVEAGSAQGLQSTFQLKAKVAEYRNRSESPRLEQSQS
jgi:hypothetical protein